MPEKKLQMKFTVAGGGSASITLDDVQQNLDSEAIGTAMQAMCNAACFQNSDGAAYTSPLYAAYVETNTTPLFNNGNATDIDDWPQD